MRSIRADQRLVWSADVFHTVNTNDIQFVAATTNQGFFDNVGGTRRQGFDVALGGKAGGVTWHLTYSFVDATFLSNFAVNAQSNSTADGNGDILDTADAHAGHHKIKKHEYAGAHFGNAG